MSPLSLSALSIGTGPTLENVAASPLSAVLKVTGSESCRVSVRVASGAVHVWRRDFFRYATSHEIPLHGFRPALNYTVTVKLHSVNDASEVTANPLIFSTSALPADFPPIIIAKTDPSRMEPGYFFTRPARNGGGATSYALAFDNEGNVVWYMAGNGKVSADARQRANGNLLSREPVAGVRSLVEINFLGNIVRQWPTPAADRLHHDWFETHDGRLLYLGMENRVIENYPTSETNPDAPTATRELIGDTIIEISMATGEELRRWSLFDILDPTRIGYQSISAAGGVPPHDWTHSNAVWHDPPRRLDRCLRPSPGLRGQVLALDGRAEMDRRVAHGLETGLAAVPA